MKVLVVLYSHSSENSGQGDASKGEEAKMAAVDPRRFIKKALQGVRMAATTTTTALGNVASEIAGRYGCLPSISIIIILTPKLKLRFAAKLSSGKSSRGSKKRKSDPCARPSTFLFLPEAGT